MQTHLKLVGNQVTSNFFELSDTVENIIFRNLKLYIITLYILFQWIKGKIAKGKKLDIKRQIKLMKSKKNVRKEFKQAKVIMNYLPETTYQVKQVQPCKGRQIDAA